MTADFPELEEKVKPVKPGELKQRIDSGEKVALLDVRSQADFEEWKIDGENVDLVNIPYFEFLDDDVDELAEEVPAGEPVVVLCGKGNSSEYVAGLLKQHGVEAQHLEDGMEGWARIYESHVIGQEPEIIQYQRPSSGCLAYMVVSNGEAAVIDPLRAFTDRYIDDARLRNAEIKHVLDTHVHADHISGLRELADKTGAKAAMSEKAIERGIKYSEKIETVSDGDKIELGDTQIETVFTPGHTTGMTAFRVGGTVFTGDGLFTESVARPDLEEGEEGAEDAARMLYDSLHEEILPLPDETVVAPAHFSDSAETDRNGGYTAELGELKQSMDALSLGKDEFVAYIVSDMPPRPANYREIIATNLGKQEKNDEEAFELELGPNNCAASQESMTA